MKITNVSTALAAAAVAAAAILAGSPIAAADDSGVTTAALGSQAKLDNNNVVQGWTVTGLKPSTDTIAYDVKGTLWEITATSEALEGSVTPIVSNFNIRSADGHNYRALFQVPTEQGVNPATIAQGEKTTGKVYFDVTGDKPTTVVYNSGGRDLLVWDAPAPAPVPVSSGQQTHTAPVAQPAVATPAPAAVPATPAPAAAPGATPATPAATPAGAGSRATDLPAATAGVPAAGTPAAGAEAVPA
ncbi:MPT63 family protein, partial [Mycolicibacterium sp.]